MSQRQIVRELWSGRLPAALHIRERTSIARLTADAIGIAGNSPYRPASAVGERQLHGTWNLAETLLIGCEYRFERGAAPEELDGFGQAVYEYRTVTR